ncbi:MAG: histidine phosphatase family protein [Bacteroidota bacterium]|nr:histidine phosphatase family protein [Candidatus Kapabacteria bacterium]MDW8272412.1 histidine phosphatase family protein [Bacteroidota bacterium]
MKQLILIRHAKAVPAEEFAGADQERPLTERGRRDAERMGMWLHAMVPQLERVVASSSVRTRQTADYLLKAWQDGMPSVEYDDALYLPSLDTLLATIWGLDPELTTVALVGHNPSISDLLEYLTGEEHVSMPTCAIAVLQTEQTAWNQVRKGCCRLMFHRTPKDLR